ncbi:MAG: DinB family protein [Bacteroidia bacterium]|nr:DinB family protein [Bacteroidia bacterium]NNF31859.1 DinB family protein [Flavobacteriaceae bacterium]NNJ82688.1 DinB family protein [Flavobacteriaceae bacterium]NNK53035.1 DinB family protein [Flavobacteriaceae bacterium]NNM07762.1 DinB family protein [Flavobacteriaceae bacterium]
MKNIRLLFILLFPLISAWAQQANPKEAFLEKWDNSKNYLLAIAEAMPEDYYDFMPTERQMSFEEQLIHIKGNMDWLSNQYFNAGMATRENIQIPDTKAEILKLIGAAFDSTRDIIASASEESLEETVEFFSGPKSRLQILNLLQDHVTHHRGQLVVYLNLKEIKPPRYIGW